MELERNVSLKPFNTFGIDVPASYFLRVRDLETLQEALASPGLPQPFILSGGSNILLTGPLDALVLYMDTRGKEIIRESPDHVRIRVMGGEGWHDLVMWSLSRGYGGLENLSLIPGKTGTAPIQNIGAYGVELQDCFVSCEAVSLKDGEIRVFDREECRFGYRDSIFKQGEKGKYIIWSVTLELTASSHRIRSDYGAIREELDSMEVSNPTPADISRAVVAIRQRKLPDPAVLGNSGSFFKNPVISGDQYRKLKQTYPSLPGYPQDGDHIKVPAGWLIESLGMKGLRHGDAGVHEKQALVLVNYGQASGADILALATEIQSGVASEFGISIEPEVNIL